jgi:hypothetical protein
MLVQVKKPTKALKAKAKKLGVKLTKTINGKRKSKSAGELNRDILKKQGSNKFGSSCGSVCTTYRCFPLGSIPNGARAMNVSRSKNSFGYNMNMESEMCIQPYKDHCINNCNIPNQNYGPKTEAGRNRYSFGKVFENLNACCGNRPNLNSTRWLQRRPPANRPALKTRN